MRSCARVPEQPLESLGKRLLDRQQADDDECLVGKIEEETGMDEDVPALHQFHHERFFTARGRYAYDMLRARTRFRATRSWMA